MSGSIGAVWALVCMIVWPLAAESVTDTPELELDSAAYRAIRAAACATGVDTTLLETADLLAGQGLFAEAYALLSEYTQRDSTKPPIRSPACQTRVQWRVSSGADYYHIEDVDTAAMTPEELRDYHRLTETPLSAWVRSTATVTPCSAFVETFEPEGSLTERKAALAVTVRSVRINGIVGFEAAMSGEKWFRPSALADSVFAPFDAQPSDMVRVALRILPGSRPDDKRILRWALPVETLCRHYRTDRPGYESSVEGRLGPVLELHPDQERVSLSLDGSLRYEDFYAGADSLDMLVVGARLSSALRYEKSRVSFEGGWNGERYMNGRHVKANDRGLVALRSTFPLAHWVEPSVNMRYRAERERLGADSISSDATALDGSELKLISGACLRAGTHISLEPGLSWDRRWASRTGLLRSYLWVARRGWEPQLECNLVWSTIGLVIRGAFRWEDIERGFSDVLADNRMIRLDAEAAVNLLRTATVLVTGEYEYRRYAPFNRAGRVSENITVSARVTVRFGTQT